MDPGRDSSIYHGFVMRLWEVERSEGREGEELMLLAALNTCILHLIISQKEITHAMIVCGRDEVEGAEGEKNTGNRSHRHFGPTTVMSRHSHYPIMDVLT